jgi:hypothetical protein
VLLLHRRRPVLATSSMITHVLDSLTSGRCGLRGESAGRGWSPVALLLLRQVFKLGIARTLRGNCLTTGRSGTSRPFGQLSAVSACCGGGDCNHCIKYLQSNTPCRQQIDQTTNHAKKKNVNQASTPNTQKSTMEPFTRSTTTYPYPPAVIKSRLPSW